jgi:hypothetical protein
METATTILWLVVLLAGIGAGYLVGKLLEGDDDDDGDPTAPEAVLAEDES